MEKRKPSEFALGDIVKMTSYDGKGFCGRDPHPKPYDVGKEYLILKVKYNDGSDFVPMEGETQEDLAFTVMDCQCLDGTERKVQLVDHEVELVSDLLRGFFFECE